MKIKKDELREIIKEEIELLQSDTPVFYLNELIKQITEKIEKIKPTVKARLTESRSDDRSSFYADLYRVNKKLDELIAAVEKLEEK